VRVGVFNTAFVGDLVLMGRLIDALALEGHEIVLFSNPAGVALYSSDKRISRTVIVRKKRGAAKIFSLNQIAKQIRDENLEVFVLAHRSLTSGLVTVLSRQSRVVTFKDSSLAHSFFSKIDESAALHESERYLRLASGLVGKSNFQNAKLALAGDCSLKRFLTAFPDFQLNSPFFVCAPGSVWATKKYPPRLLASVIGRVLSEQPHMRCVLSGGPSDAADIAAVIDEIRENEKFATVFDRVVDARDCLPLPELIEVIRQAKFVLTPDSAPLHIASATGTKTFVFFGPTPSNTGFAPLSPGSKVLDHLTIRGRQLNCQPCSKHGQMSCPLTHHGCLADLPPDAVAVAVLESTSGGTTVE
jgi:heptosyltransferase-2